MMIPTSNNLNVYWFIRIPVASSLFDCPDHRRSLGGQSITSRLPLVPSWDCHGAVPNLEENWPRCRGMTWFPTTSWESRNCVTPPRYPRIGTFGWENQWFAKLLFFVCCPFSEASREPSAAKDGYSFGYSFRTPSGLIDVWVFKGWWMSHCGELSTWTIGCLVAIISSVYSCIMFTQINGSFHHHWLTMSSSRSKDPHYTVLHEK